MLQLVDVSSALLYVRGELGSGVDSGPGTHSRRLIGTVLSRIFFALACVAVPILWGIAVNWMFGRLQKSAPSTTGRESESGIESNAEQDEPLIEYYI